MASSEIGQLEVHAVIRSFYAGEMPTTGVRIPRGVIWRQLLNSILPLENTNLLKSSLPLAMLLKRSLPPYEVLA